MSQIPISYTCRVAWGDVDSSGAWRFVSALDYVEEAETQLMREAGVLHDVTHQLPRIYVEAQFKRQAHFDDVVVVQLSLVRLGNSSIHYEFVIVRESDLLVEGRLGVVFVGASGRSEPLPDAIRSRFLALTGLRQ